MRWKPIRKKRNAASFEAPKTDPQGSWTGVPDDPFEEPQQDADDL